MSRARSPLAASRAIKYWPGSAQWRRRRRRDLPCASNNSSKSSPHAFFDHSPFAGRANPLAPPIEMEIVGERVIAHVNYGV